MLSPTKLTLDARMLVGKYAKVGVTRRRAQPNTQVPETRMAFVGCGWGGTEMWAIRRRVVVSVAAGACVAGQGREERGEGRSYKRGGKCMTEQQFIQTKDISAKSAVKDVARKKAMTGVDLSRRRPLGRRVVSKTLAAWATFFCLTCRPLSFSPFWH